MIDPDLKKQLDQLDAHLVEIRKSNAISKSFWRGFLSGIGSIIGVAITVALIGWILNTIGVIPAFREQARQWQETLEGVRRIR
jgi:hypothetical protein